jgi:histidinol phosphatase-like PHP family hydrolase
MIDLHMHTLWSDGALLPAELVRRAKVAGIKTMAITDHIDQSNIETTVPAIVKFCKQMEKDPDITVLPGMEITHVMPNQISALARRGRKLGAKWIVVHGESPVEPVIPGTNLAAIKAGVDLLAHPGIIKKDDVKLAVKKGVALEITARQGHSLGNGRLAKYGKQLGAAMILNTDTHGPGDLIDATFAKTVALGAGLSENDFKNMLATSEKLSIKALKRGNK